MYCKSEPHRRGCPCYDDSKKEKNKCSMCGGEFSSGGVCVDGEMICGECIEDVDIFDLLNLLGCDSVAQLIGMIEDV